MLIDVSDVSTIPVEIKDKIYNAFSALTPDVIDKIRNQKIRCNNDIRCAIKAYYSPFKCEVFYNVLM